MKWIPSSRGVTAYSQLSRHPSSKFMSQSRVPIMLLRNLNHQVCVTTLGFRSCSSRLGNVVETTISTGVATAREKAFLSPHSFRPVSLSFSVQHFHFRVRVCFAGQTMRETGVDLRNDCLSRPMVRSALRLLC